MHGIVVSFCITLRIDAARAATPDVCTKEWVFFTHCRAITMQLARCAVVIIYMSAAARDGNVRVTLLSHDYLADCRGVETRV